MQMTTTNHDFVGQIHYLETFTACIKRVTAYEDPDSNEELREKEKAGEKAASIAQERMEALEHGKETTSGGKKKNSTDVSQRALISPRTYFSTESAAEARGRGPVDGMTWSKSEDGIKVLRCALSVCVCSSCPPDLHILSTFAQKTV
jgi:hypothetical protein